MISLSQLKKSPGLEAVHQVTSSHAVGRRAAAAQVESVARSEEIVNGDLGNLRDGKLPLRAVCAADDVGQRDTAAPRDWLYRLVASRKLSIRLGFQRRQGRRGVRQAEAPERGKIVGANSGEGTQARRVRRGRQRRVIRSRRQGIVREGGRRRGGRVRRIGPRPLRVAVRVVVIVGLVVRVRAGHVVRSETRELVPRGMEAVGVVRVMPCRAVKQVRGHLALDLVGSPAEQRDITTAGAPGRATSVGAEARVGRVVVVRAVRVGRRDVRRRHARGGRRSDGLGSGRRGHHLRLEVGVLLAMLVSPAGVGVAVYPRVTGQLVGSRELLGATRKLADVRLLAGVGADVPRLVLQTVECLVAEGAFVRPRQLGCCIHGLSTGEGPIGTYHGDSRHAFVSRL